MIVDVLWGKFVANMGGNGAADDGSNKFAVNTAVNDVALDVSQGWNYVFGVPLAPASHYYKVQARDGLTVLSVGCMLPYHFTWSDMGCMSFGYWAKNGASIQYAAINQINTPSGQLPVPFTNYELSIGPYVPWPVDDSIGGPYPWYNLVANFRAGRVSMIGVPASLNTQTITPIPFVKVQHTLPFLH